MEKYIRQLERELELLKVIFLRLKLWMHLQYLVACQSCSLILL